MSHAIYTNEGDKMKTVLEVRDLVKYFNVGHLFKPKYVHAVEKVSFSIGSGEVLGLVGESGSGKTTAARVIAKLYEPTSGEIKLFGEIVPTKMSRKRLLKYRKNVQMIFQDPFASLNPLHKVRYMISRPLKIHRLVKGKEIESKIGYLLEECELIPAKSFLDKYPYELSGGERQRIGIARALAVKPKLVLADEPTSMLDVSIRLDIMNLMLDLKEKEGLSYLYITHDLAGAHYMSDRIAIMYAGMLMELGPSDEIIEHPLHPYTKLLKKAAPKPEESLRPERLVVGEEIPDLVDPPKGCRFYPRCPYATKICSEEVPNLEKVSSGHFVRCFLYSK